MNNVEIQMGKIIQLKKSHPSGTINWKIIKLGTDIKLSSEEVPNTYIIINRTKLLKNIK